MDVFGGHYSAHHSGSLSHLQVWAQAIPVLLQAVAAAQVGTPKGLAVILVIVTKVA